MNRSLLHFEFHGVWSDLDLWNTSLKIAADDTQGLCLSLFSSDKLCFIKALKFQMKFEFFLLLTPPPPRLRSIHRTHMKHRIFSISTVFVIDCQINFSHNKFLNISGNEVSSYRICLPWHDT